jgi:hypothetical protein
MIPPFFCPYANLVYAKPCLRNATIEKAKKGFKSTSVTSWQQHIGSRSRQRAPGAYRAAPNPGEVNRLTVSRAAGTPGRPVVKSASHAQHVSTPPVTAPACRVDLIKDIIMMPNPPLQTTSPTITIPKRSGLPQLMLKTSAEACGENNSLNDQGEEHRSKFSAQDHIQGCRRGKQARQRALFLLLDDRSGLCLRR